VAKELKEYESIEVVKHLMHGHLKNKIELRTIMAYKIVNGDKGWIIRIKSKKD